MLARTRVHFRPLSKDPCHRGNGMNLTRTRLGLFLASALLWACGDVEVRPDSKSGEDFERAGAQQLFFDKLDRRLRRRDERRQHGLEVHEGPGQGLSESSRSYWDNKEIDSTVEVRDRFGAIVQSWAHSKEVEKDEQEMKVEPGTHFIRLHVDKKASVYTMDGHVRRVRHGRDGRGRARGRRRRRPARRAHPRGATPMARGRPEGQARRANPRRGPRHLPRAGGSASRARSSA
jgi:hypothetical protein